MESSKLDHQSTKQESHKDLHKIPGAQSANIAGDALTSTSINIGVGNNNIIFNTASNFYTKPNTPIKGTTIGGTNDFNIRITTTHHHFDFNNPASNKSGFLTGNNTGSAFHGAVRATL